ncbi:DUF6338 family protein [Paenarthrobacter nitroguajacolicus]|uniref:DUF6338 family protein n=1 Tax=Paenarthrobacter nitroguajacolicus TaxID=211146 RepID=UPI0028594B44|nr:DUF6338 family protein [Paenarthrobacter nitroguajacolicus]MDR6639614.1 hypothetical protein [Paenarthrobacter nitroguajacolicus]
MPTEPVAALLYVCLLLPGIAFIWRYEGHGSVVKRSAFRETAAVVIASAASLVAVFILHYIAAFFFEPARSTLRQFFIEPGVLFRQDSQVFFGVTLIDLALAVSFGTFFGSESASRFVKWCRGKWLKMRKKTPETIERGQSAWNTAFEMMPGHKVIVGVQLKSGAWIQGALKSFSRNGDETPDRAFTLTGEIWYRMADGENVHRLEPHGTVVIQAPEVDYLTVGYEEPEEPVPEQPDRKRSKKPWSRSSARRRGTIPRVLPNERAQRHTQG